MQVHPVGADAFLAEVDSATDVAALYADLRRDLRCRDLVPGARTVLVDGPDDADALLARLAAWSPGAPEAAKRVPSSRCRRRTTAPTSTTLPTSGG